MLSIIKNEIYKLFARKTLYVFIGIIFMIVVFNIIGTLVTNNTALGRSFGENFPITLFETAASIIMPVFIIVTVSTLVADEFAEGTLKLTLLRKVGRSKLLFGKVCALGTVITGLLLILLLLGYGLGTALFGWGGEFLIKGKHLTSSQGVVLTLLTYVLAIIPYLSFGMLILFISLLTKNGGTTTAIGTGILFFSLFLEIVFPDLSTYLISNYFNTYRIIIDDNGTRAVILGFLIIFGYGIVLYVLNLKIFNGQDLMT